MRIVIRAFLIISCFNATVLQSKLARSEIYQDAIQHYICEFKQDKRLVHNLIASIE